MSKSVRSVKRMPMGSAKGTASGKDGMPPMTRHGTAPQKACPPCADHGSAVDKMIPMKVMRG